MTRTDFLYAFKNELDKLAVTVADKNADYAGDGDAFHNFNLVERITQGACKREMGMLVRMTDKVSRVGVLLANDKRPAVDESLDDSLRDLAAYCLLMVVSGSDRREQHLTQKPSTGGTVSPSLIECMTNRADVVASLNGLRGVYCSTDPMEAYKSRAEALDKEVAAIQSWLDGRMCGPRLEPLAEPKQLKLNLEPSND